MPHKTVSEHKERVSRVFKGERPDRIPICEQAFASTVASELIGYTAYTGSTDLHYLEACAWLDGDNAHGEFVEKCYEDVIRLHQLLDFDILYLPWRMTRRPTKRLDDSHILYGDPDGDWSVYKYSEQTHTYGLESSSIKSRNFEDVEPAMRAIVEHFDLAKADVSLDPMLERAVKEYGDTFEVAGGSGMAVPMEAGWLEATLIDPGLVAAYLDTIIERELYSLELHSRKGISLINGGGDFAFNSGTIYSPAFFFQVMAPRWKMLFDKCHSLSMNYIFRSDGNLWDVSDALFSEGLADAYYEVDYDAGMTFDRLRARYPKLVLFGNVSCDALVRNTPEEIRQRVLECYEAAYPRLVLGSSNAILHGTPVENVLAMYDTAKNI